MAIISFSELVEVLKQHPHYKPKWEKETPAELALCIKFGAQESLGTVESEVFPAVDGHEIVIDRVKDGRIWSIEII